MRNYKKSIFEMQFNFDFLPIKVHPVINFGLENLLIWAYRSVHGKNRFATARGKFRFSRAIYPPPAVLEGLEASGGVYLLPVSSVRAQEASFIPK